MLLPLDSILITRCWCVIVRSWRLSWQEKRILQTLQKWVFFPVKWRNKQWCYSIIWFLSSVWIISFGQVVECWNIWWISNDFCCWVFNFSCHSGYIYYNRLLQRGPVTKKWNRSSQITVIDSKTTALKNAIEWHCSHTLGYVGTFVKFH